MKPRARGTALAAATGRADLFLALDRDGEGGLQAMAELLGYVDEGSRDPEEKVPAAPIQGPSQPGPFSPTAVSHAFRPIPFWRPVAAELTSLEDLGENPESSRDSEEVQKKLAGQIQDDQDALPPPSPPLVAWPRLWRHLDDGLRTRVPRREVDTVELVRRWARGESVEPLPRRAGLRHGGVVLLVDRSPSLAPFRRDQLALAGELLRRLGFLSLRIVVLATGVAQDLHPRDDERVLALTDLGCLDGAERVARWRRLGLRLRRRRVPTLALVPTSPSRWDPATAALWSARQWSAPDRTPHPAVASAEERPGPRLDPVETLLRLASPAVRLETGLLRQLRRLVPGADPATEAQVWRHPAITSRSPLGLVLDATEARRRRPLFLELEEELQRQAIESLRAWHEQTHPEVWHEEVAVLLALGVPESRLGAATVARTTAFLARAGALVERGSERPGDLTSQVEPWFGRFAGRVSRPVWRHPRFRASLVPALRALRRRQRDDDPIAGTTPDMLPPTSGEAQRWNLWQEGPELRLRPWDPTGRAGRGSLVASVMGRGGEAFLGDGAAPDHSLALPGDAGVSLAPQTSPSVHLTTDLESVELEPWTPPSWASAAGRDEHGLWLAFEVKDMTQRLRWIPPGRFQMGSPESEAGRWDDEGPRHWVVLTEGFWLADTPCTQALSEAVMGKKPSRFPSPRRPVEQVSWDDCQRFLRRLNREVPGLQACLPTEAQWEYACRAGTETATWAGDLEILGERNAPLLDEIAWYGGNSGVDFDLENGWDSSGWEEKQYPHTVTGTREVGGKEPNPWGLFDMLGNVWEWCQDYWADEYLPQPQTNPTGPKGGALRVFRGGAWRGYARGVRAAYRGGYPPDVRLGYLGFRLARGQGRFQGGAQARRSGAARRGTRRRAP